MLMERGYRIYAAEKRKHAQVQTGVIKVDHEERLGLTDAYREFFIDLPLQTFDERLVGVDLTAGELP